MTLLDFEQAVSRQMEPLVAGQLGMAKWAIRANHVKAQRPVLRSMEGR